MKFIESTQISNIQEETEKLVIKESLMQQVAVENDSAKYFSPKKTEFLFSLSKMYYGYQINDIPLFQEVLIYLSSDGTGYVIVGVQTCMKKCEKFSYCPESLMHIFISKCENCKEDLI